MSYGQFTVNFVFDYFLPTMMWLGIAVVSIMIFGLFWEHFVERRADRKRGGSSAEDTWSRYRR